MPRAKGTDPYARRFGDIIQHLRYGMRWTLEDFGKATGMHPDYLGLLERGLNVPTLGTILRIADALDVSVCKLLEPIEKDYKEVRRYTKALSD